MSAAAGPASLNAGQQVLASLRTGDVAFYDDSGALIGRAGRRRRRGELTLATEVVALPKREMGLPRRAPLRRASGSLAFIGAVGYLTIYPLIRLQYLALKDGAQPYKDAYTRPDVWRTIQVDDLPRPGLARDRGRARHGARLGRVLAPAPASHPEGRPDPSDHPAPGGSRARLGIPALAAPGLPQPDPPEPALVERAVRRAVRHLHAAVDHHHHRARAGLVRLSLRQRRPRKHQRRADRGRVRQRLVGLRRLLQDRAAAPPPCARVRDRRGAAARPRSVHRAAPAGREPGDHGAHDRHVLADAADTGSVRRGRGDRLAAARLRDLRAVHEPGAPRRQLALRHARRQGRLPARRARLVALCGADRPVRRRCHLPAAHGARDRLALEVLDRQLRHQHVDARQLARRSPTLPG